MLINSETLVAQIYTIINKFFFFEKKNILQFKGIRLYPSEIHLMLEINEKQAVNASRIAERFGITKGAVSQTITRLESKGILHKIKDPYNKNELSFLFTPTGKEVIKEFKQRQKLVLNQYLTFFTGLTESEREVIQRFLSEMEGMIDK
jgi:DNA-binding MarR family transcriptional regulator